MGQEGERPEKKWTFKELSSAISDLQRGRSFEKGRKLYKQIKPPVEEIVVGAEACLNDTDQARLTELLRELIDFIPDQR